MVEQYKIVIAGTTIYPRHVILCRWNRRATVKYKKKMLADADINKNKYDLMLFLIKELIGQFTNNFILKLE